MSRKTSNELRCICSRRPLLATYGVTDKGDLYVHVKIFKQRRIYGEILVTEGGRIQLHCRECLRWNAVIIRGPGEASLLPDQAVPPFVEDSTADATLAPPAHEP